MTNPTDYDCAAHVAGVGMAHGITAVEYLAARAATEYDTHPIWYGYAKPTPQARALIRTASERLNKNAGREG